MNSICVLAIEEKTCDFMVDTLQESIGEFVNVQAYDCKNPSTTSEQSPLIIAAGKKSYKRAKSLFPTSKVITAKRRLNFTKLEEVFPLPSGETALVINYSKDPTIETIHSLQKIGLDHLRYIPYWKDSRVNAKRVDTAISPGMIDLCPDYIDNKIDIGMRDIALSTYIQILLHFGIDLDYIDAFIQNYIKLYIETHRRLDSKLDKAEALRVNMHSILNELGYGFVFIDEEYNVSALNRAAERILGHKKQELLENSAKTIFKLLPDLSERVHKNHFFKAQGKTYASSCIPLMRDSGYSFVLTFMDPAKTSQVNISKGQAKGFSAKWYFDDIIGKASSMTALIDKASLISRTDSTVLLMGESGTGKELFAQAIHNASPRRNAPFIAVNFAALPENLAESELFGFEEGSFTGAKKGGRVGLFEQANGGTIFLDEIGDASLHTQKKLLRVLQEKEIMKIGGSNKIKLDVRIIAATNRDLKQLIKEGSFREDLYFRLRVCPLTIPPLRKRKEDIPRFIQAFMEKYKVHKDISSEARNSLISYKWPGTVRELENTIEYLASVCESDRIEIQHLPEEISKYGNSGNHYDELSKSLERMKCLFNPSDVSFVLRTLSDYKAKGISIGRNKLASLAKKQGLALTESKVRTMLEHLDNHGLVVIGKTKQGTLITEKGKQALLELQN